jgi:hypothetical protein
MCTFLVLPHYIKLYTQNGGEFMINIKSNITISVPGNTTPEEIKIIRQEFNKSELSQEYKLNIIVSGCADPVENFGTFLASWIKK